MNPKDQIKDTLSIVDVVSTYIRIEKSGSQYKARCPFHNERTPSFYVSPERKSYHCFGCGEHGDIFSFIEKIENIPFFEALKILADRSGVSLKDAKHNEQESRLVALLKDATDHFQTNLQTQTEAREYLLGRGLTEETITTFRIGYAKNEWRDLFIFLAHKGYKEEEMEQAGLVIKTEKGYYDRFRGRIMFPIRNVSGVTVGYSGRILPSLVDPTKEVGKYVNTPETPLYHKSKILFGYDTAKKTMNEKKEVIIVEGQMDLCMSYQAGVHNTVAVSGTAFTDEHINLIKRFCDRVVLAFDTDSAGQAALKKTALMSLLAGVDVYVVKDIATKDPADLIRDSGGNVWVQAVSSPRHIIEALLATTLDTSVDERERGKLVVTTIIPYVRAVQSPVDRDHFIKMISSRTHISEQALLEELVRGIQLEVVVEEKTSRQQESRKDKVLRELIAFMRLYAREHDPLVGDLSIDTTFFPEEIIHEEMFRLEKQSGGNSDAYFKDLLQSYRHECKQERVREIQAALRESGADHESLMRELQDLVR